MLEAGEVRHFEESYPLPDGNTAYFIYAKFPIRDRAGNVTCIGCIATDITKQKRMEAQLRESEARIQAIVNTAVDGIITSDEQGIIESFNPAAEQLFGYQGQEVMGQNIAMLMPSPYQENHADYLAHYLDTGERKIIGIGREVAGQRQDGTIFPLDLAVSELYLADRRIFTGIVRDITERK